MRSFMLLAQAVCTTPFSSFLFRGLTHFCTTPFRDSVITEIIPVASSGVEDNEKKIRLMGRVHLTYRDQWDSVRFCRTITSRFTLDVLTCSSEGVSFHNDDRTFKSFTCLSLSLSFSLSLSLSLSLSFLVCTHTLAREWTRMRHIAWWIFISRYFSSHYISNDSYFQYTYVQDISKQPLFLLWWIN